MQIAYIVLTVVLGVAALFGLFTFALRERLNRLEKRFGGNVTSDLFRPAYILEDIKLIYNYGSQYTQGVTTIKVITKPKKPITLEISPKMSLFKIKGETFEELYDCKCIVQDGFPLLTDDLKCFLAANVDCCINLSINQNEFILTCIFGNGRLRKRTVNRHNMWYLSQSRKIQAFMEERLIDCCCKLRSPKLFSALQQID